MDKIKKFVFEKWHILVLALLIVIISWPALFMVMAKGHDLDFHLMRMEGIRQDISLHNIPVRMQSSWIDGYGYPVSILYGDLFLYLGAFFRALGFKIMPAYRLFVVCINTATVAIAFNSFKTVFKKKETALFSTILYTTAAYRLVDEYVRSAVGETLTIVFLPAIVACIYVIYTSDESKIRWKAAVVLAFVFTSITCAHTLTTSMLIVVFAPGCLISLFLFCKKGERLKRFGNIIGAGCLTVLLAAFFVVPFLDFYMNADIGFALEEGVNIQGEGLTMAEMLDFFANPFNTSTNDIQKTPGLALMLGLVCGIVYLIYSLVKKKKFAAHRRILFEGAFAIVLLFMTTHVFPWNFIEKNVPFGGILTAIEFPMRYLAFALVMLALLSGDLLQGLVETLSSQNGPAGENAHGFDAKKIMVCAFALVSLIGIYNVTNVCVNMVSFEKKALFMETEDLGRWDYYAMDFQLKNSTVDDLDLGVKQESLLAMDVVSRDGNDWMIACVSGPDYGWVQLPVFAYPYYHATDVANPATEFEIHEGANRTVGVLLPGNYSGILHVYWAEPVLWKVMEWISLLTFVGCVVFLVRKTKTV